MNQHNVMALLNIRMGESKLVLLLFSLAYVEYVANALARTTTYAIFLAEFSAETLPYAYIGVAIFASLVSYLVLRLTQRVSLANVLLGSFAFVALLMFALWLGVALLESRWVAFSMPIAFGILNTLMISGYWALVGRLLNLDQSKRLTGLLATGESLAFMMAGFMMPLLVLWMGAVNILLLAALIMTVSWAILFYVTRHYGGQLRTAPVSRVVEAEEEGAHQPTESLFKSGYIRLIILLFALFIVGIYFVDNIFYAVSEIRFPDADQLASFVGLFWGVSSVFVLAMQAFVSGRIMVRFGVGAVMMLTPTVLAIEAGMMALAGTLLGVGALFFALAVLANLSRVILDATDQAAVNVLYQPLPADLRAEAQTMVGGIVYPLSIGLAGVFLLLLRNVFNLNVVQLTYFLLAITLAWLSTAVLLRRAYPKALLRALTRRDFGDTDYLEADPSSLAVIEQGLKSPHVGVVLYSLDLLERVDPTSIPLYLPNLLEHPTAEVRVEVLRRMEDERLQSALPVIAERISEEESVAVRAAALRTMAVLGGAETFEKLLPYLDDSDPLLRKGLLVGLLRSGEIEGIVEAATRLIQHINAPEPTGRLFAAQVLGESAMLGFYRPLRNLLQDDDPGVQRAALAAAGRVKEPLLWPSVVKSLAVRELRAEASTALISGGEAAVASIEAGLSASTSESGEWNREACIRMARVLGRIGGQRAISVLEPQMAFPDEQIRTQVLMALARCRYQVEPSMRAAVETNMKAEIGRAVWLAAVLQDLGDNPTLQTVQSALRQHLDRHRLRLLLWLSFLHDAETIERVISTLGVAESTASPVPVDPDALQQRSYALEAIDVLLPAEQKSMVLPLAEGLPPPQLLQRLSGTFPQERKEIEMRLQEIVEGPNFWLTPWIKATALASIAQLPAPTLVSTVLGMLDSPEPLIRETAIGTLASLDTSAYQHQLDRLVDDANPQVARAARQAITAQRGDTPMLSTVEKVIALKAQQLFAGTSDEVLADVASILEECALRGGETIFEKGDAGDSLYIVVEGEIRIHDRDRTILTKGANEAFGEFAVLAPAPRSASATALVDSQLLQLDQASFRELLTDHSEVAWHVIQFLTDSLRASSAQIVNTLGEDEVLEDV